METSKKRGGGDSPTRAECVSNAKKLCPEPEPKLVSDVKGVPDEYGFAKKLRPEPYCVSVVHILLEENEHSKMERVEFIYSDGSKNILNVLCTKDDENDFDDDFEDDLEWNLEDKPVIASDPTEDMEFVF